MRIGRRDGGVGAAIIVHDVLAEVLELVIGRAVLAPVVRDDRVVQDHPVIYGRTRELVHPDATLRVVRDRAVGDPDVGALRVHDGRTTRRVATDGAVDDVPPRED